MAIKMKKCVKCGKIIPDFAQYCVYCRQNQSKSPNNSTSPIDFSSLTDKVNDFRQTQNQSVTNDNEANQTTASTEQVKSARTESTDNSMHISGESTVDDAIKQDQEAQSSQSSSVTKSSSTLMIIIFGLIVVIIVLVAFIIIHHNRNDSKEASQDDDYEYVESSSDSDDDSDPSYTSSSSDDDSDIYEDEDDDYTDDEQNENDDDYTDDEQNENEDSNLTGEEDSTTPDFSTEVLSDDYIESLSDEELQLEINTLYAVKGYHFKTSSIQEYFDSKSWYEDEGITDQNEIKDSLDSTELKNWEKLSRERDNRR